MAFLFRPLAFLDDDVRKHGARIHGVPVVRGLAALERVAQRHDVQGVLIGTRKLKPEVLQMLKAIAPAHGLELLELEIGVRRVVDMAVEGTVEGPAAAAGGRKVVVRQAVVGAS